MQELVVQAFEADLGGIEDEAPEDVDGVEGGDGRDQKLLQDKN